MTDLLATYALGGGTPSVVNHGPYTLAERGDLRLMSLAFPTGLHPEHIVGVAPPQAGQGQFGGAVDVIWTGPSQYMAMGADLTALDAGGARVTDQSDGWITLDILGGDIDALLPHLVNLPPRVLAPGGATRTLISHFSAFALRPEKGTLRLLVARSYGADMWHHLSQILSRRAKT
ncbi:sarcosine oxidase subunit gamma [Rhodovulum sp. FJ3]|uniref:sarcosine oxidase subunit gamma n=1 Tax=Rhodovulum sp. FJ3 TaxID=3079053 RepID=UPI00293DF367|nr:sarcosine oxidase subunit gamma [Rhodovulum sp. FJ3]MDV4167429.1 sarcosine oxidase subunit gamma [Rhodovulum sp. FJ3]